MSERYRTHYDSEFVIVSNKIQGGKKYQEREWIDNPIQNQHISGRAAVIGHGDSRYTTKLHGKFNLCNNIEKHKGGHLARKRLQSYGAEKVWEEMICDFYVEFDVPTLEKLIETKYNEKTSVYSNARNCINSPGEFYLVPYGERGRSVAVAAWLACFDGHDEVYLIGVDGTNAAGEVDETTVHQFNRVITSYPGVKFVYVSDSISPPSVWKENVNFSQCTYGNFVSKCDI